ncbi:MAG: hypothetical protein P8X50_15545, partial [Maritimibacter sp.]
MAMLSDEGLIRPRDEIFDQAAVDSALAAAIAAAGDDNAAIRTQCVAILREVLTTGRSAIAAGLEEAPFSAHPVVQAYAWLTDRVVCSIFRIASEVLHPVNNPTSGERLAVLAVGGYGRFEMAPFSDVDLLFLTPYKLTPWTESVIESMLYMLWDLRLKVGHASRSVKDCLRLGKEDFTIRTALLEHRQICGDDSLTEQEQMALEVAANASLSKSLSYRIYENGKALKDLTDNQGVILEDTPPDYFTEYMAAAKKLLEKAAA